ncbi:hypothetical protein ACIP5Z_01780 [Rothia terrae]|uniref:hypothetical protein n=1 Tax=Rothia terrae TaxID=396015 RepID=UPI00382784AE
MASVPVTNTPSKTVGTTTVATSTGATAGLLVAFFIQEALGLNLSSVGLAGLSVVLTLAGGFIAGWLSPSKAGEAQAAAIGAAEALAPVIADRVAASIPEPAVYADAVAQVAPTASVPSAGEVADAVLAKQSEKEHALVEDADEFEPLSLSTNSSSVSTH